MVDLQILVNKLTVPYQALSRLGRFYLEGPKSVFPSIFFLLLLSSLSSIFLSLILQLFWNSSSPDSTFFTQLQSSMTSEMIKSNFNSIKNSHNLMALLLFITLPINHHLSTIIALSFLLFLKDYN